MEPEPDVVQGLDPTPTRLEDPPGLDAAIVDGSWALAESVIGYRSAPSDDTIRHATATITAAAPALRAGALRDAADKLNRFAIGEEVGVLRWLRQLADEEAAK